jgi:hypothetical protein
LNVTGDEKIPLPLSEITASGVLLPLLELEASLNQSAVKIEVGLRQRVLRKVYGNACKVANLHVLYEKHGSRAAGTRISGADCNQVRRISPFNLRSTLVSD